MNCNNGRLSDLNELRHGVFGIPGAICSFRRLRKRKDLHSRTLKDVKDLYQWMFELHERLEDVDA